MNTLTREISLSCSAGRKSLPSYLGASADALVGLDLVLFAGDITRLMMPDQTTILGFATESVMRFLGVFLILFAVDTILIARSHGALGRFLTWIVAANWATVALAGVVLALWHAMFSAVGIALVAGVMAAVGAFAFLQQRSL